MVMPFQIKEEGRCWKDIMRNYKLYVKPDQILITMFTEFLGYPRCYLVHYLCRVGKLSAQTCEVDSMTGWFLSVFCSYQVSTDSRLINHFNPK